MNALLIPALCAAVLVGCDGSQAQVPVPAPSPSASASAKSPETAAAAPVVTNEAPTKPAETAAASSSPVVENKIVEVKIKSPSELPAPVQEVVRLAQTTLGESVLLSYINNITESFKLSADQVIYLSDLGLSGTVVNALLTRQTELRPDGSSATSTLAGSGVTSPATPTGAPTAQPEVTKSDAPAIASNLNGPGGYAYADVPGGTAEPPPIVYGPPQTETLPNPPGNTVVNYNTFYDSLSPYGTWVEEADYGYCWRPTVAVIDTGWHPYLHNGSWAWSDYGWYWNSGYSWGWAPFHYGRWHRSSRVGWVWQPGCDWGPAWVNWSYTGDHCAWAPLPPECHWSAGVGFSWRHGGNRVSVGFGLTPNCYVGVGWSDFSRPRLWEHRVPAVRVTEIVSHGKNSVVGDRHQVVKINGNNNTVIINNGAPYDKVRNASRDEIRKVSIADVNHPAAAVGRTSAGSANRPVIAAYRPQLSSAVAQPKAPPATVINRQREEERKTAATPAIVASRPTVSRAVPSSLPSTSGAIVRNEAPSRSSSGIVSSTTPARPTGINNSGSSYSAPSYSAPSRGNLNPTTTSPAPRNSQSASRPSIGPAPRPGETFANPNVVTPSATSRRDEAPNRSSGPVTAPTQSPYRPYTAYGAPRPNVTTPSPSSAPSRATELSQDNSRIQNPVLSPRLEERKATPRYDYGNAPGAASRPAPNYSAPQSPSYSASAPAARPNFSSPGYNSSRPSYEGSSARPAPSYSPPAPSARYEAAPSRSYSAPAPNYSAPAPTHSAPASRPAPTYSAPASRPAPSYSAPAPAPSRSSPAPTYSAPSSSRSGSSSDNNKNGRN